MRMAMQAGLAMMSIACGDISVGIDPDGSPSAADAAATPDAAVPDAAAPDADRPDAAVGSPCVWTEPYTAPMVNLNDADDQAGSTITADGLVVFFTIQSVDGGPADIFDAARAAPDQVFSAPRLLTELATTEEEEFEPEVSGTGDEIFFNRDSQPIQRALRTSPGGPFGEVVSTGLQGFSASLSGDGLSLYFIDNSDERIMRATRRAVGELFGPPTEVGKTNGYFSIDVSADELRVLLAGPFLTGEGSVAIASRASTDEPFGAPVSAGDVFPREGDEEEPMVEDASWTGDGTQMVIAAFDFIDTVSDDLLFSSCQVAAPTGE